MLETVEWAAEAHSMWLFEPVRPEFESCLHQLLALWPFVSYSVQ